MSILDTFYILFKTDADQAAKDIKEVDKASDQAAGGLKKMDAAASGVGTSFVTMAGRIVGALAAIVSVGQITGALFEKAGAIRELDQFSSKLNSSVSDVDAFQRSVKAMGGETATALDSLVKIGEKVNEAFSDKESGARKDFDQWGLAFKNAKGEALGASEAMLELASNLEGVSRAEALARIKKLGIEDAATIDLLVRGRAALEARIDAEKRLGVVTEEQAASVREYYEELGQAQNALTSLGNAIFEWAAPAMTAFARAFRQVTTWMAENKTLVTGFFIGIAGVITAMYLPAIYAAAAATIAATWPFLAIGAAIAAVGAAFALAYEDVVAFLNGQPSLIGALAERYEWFGDIIKGIGDAYEALKTGGAAAIDGLLTAWDMFVQAANTAAEAQKAFWSTVEPIWTSLKDLASSVLDLFSAIGDRIKGDIAEGLAFLGERFSDAKQAATDFFQSIFGDVSEVSGAVATASNAIRDGFTGAFNAVMVVWDATIGRIAGMISGIADRIRGLAASIRGAGDAAPAAANDNLANAGATIGAMAGGQRMLNAASGSSINGQTSASIAGAGAVNNTSNVSVGNVTVNTQATDARAVAGAVKGELQRQLRGTAAQFDDGVDR